MAALNTIIVVDRRLLWYTLNLNTKTNFLTANGTNKNVLFQVWKSVLKSMAWVLIANTEFYLLKKLNKNYKGVN